MRPLHIGYDIFRHPNGVIPTPFLLPNLESNHLTISFLLDHIGDAIVFIPPVRLGVDERTLDCKLFSCSSHPKASSLVEDTCWTCGLLCRGGPLGLATPIFSISLSSLEPKSLRIVILTIILVPLIALSFDHQNHSKWHKRCNVRYNLPLFGD